MYIRLVSNEMFRISKDVVQKILLGEPETPQEALDAFNAELAGDDPEDQVVAHIDTVYSYDFSPEHGNQATSAIFNTVRTEIGTDLLFAQACYVSGDIYTGDYTKREKQHVRCTRIGQL